MRAHRPFLAAPLLVLAACGGPTEPRPAPGASGGGDAPARAVAEAFAAEQAADAEALGLPTSFVNPWGMRFELVPAGTFVMGSAPGEPGRGADETPHEVREVLSYYVAARETPAGVVAAWRGLPAPAAPDSPAEGLSLEDAEALAAWLSERDPSWAYRVPTEAEWERAARTVGAGGAAEGMSSDPWERCADRYGPYPDWLVSNPAGPDEGEDRVVRGGAGARASTRRRAGAGDHASGLGVRLVAPLAYGKANLGRVTLSFRSVETDEALQPVRDAAGLEVRILTVVDRLTARQAARDLPWQTIPALRTPFAWRVPPGRYYAQCQTPGTDKWRGVEIKIDADRPEIPVVLPAPRAGALLPKPQ